MSDPEIRPGIRRLLRLAVRRPDHAAVDADEEIRLHLALRAQQLEQEGLAPEAAQAEAARRFGPVEEAGAAVRASAARRDRQLRLRERAGDALQSVRLAVRGLRRAPGFAATVITCIALGVGANAAAFSLLDELIRRPLPVHEPGRLVNLAGPGPRPGSDTCNQSGTCDEVFSLPMFRDLARAPNTGLTGLAAHRLFLAGVAPAAGARGDALPGDGVFVSGSYFPLLGLRPALGRLLGPSDDVTAGGHPVAVVSHAYWTARMGADPAAVGRTLLVNGRALTVVGVAPPEFEGTTIGLRPLVYVPLVMAATVDPFFGPRDDLTNRTRYWTYVFGRLQPGATRERAQAALTATYRPILAEVELGLHPGMSEQTRARFLRREVAVADGSGGQATLRGATRMPLLLLFAITALVVLIACANVANLLLVRGTARATEIAVRASLGATRARLAGQLLVEAGVLAALGGVASLAVAWGTLRFVGAFLPEPALGFGVELSLALRPSVLLFAGLVALGTGLLFGLMPALHATRPALMGTIRAGIGQVTGAQRAAQGASGARTAARVRMALVTAQVALSMALLGSGALLVRSLRNLSQVELGMDARQVVQFAMLPELSGRTRQEGHAILARLEDELATMPGAGGATVSAVPLLTNSTTGGQARVQGFVRGPDTDADVRMNRVGAQFFGTLGIPLLAGRAFTPADRAGAPPVAVVTEAFVRKFGASWGTAGRPASPHDAVGRRMALDGRSPDDQLDIEIVGVVRDARYNTVRAAPPPLVYLPWRQDSTVTAAMLYVRAERPVDEVQRAIPGAVARIDRTLPIALLKPLTRQVEEHLYLDRLVGSVAAGFALLATLLAAVGLHGVLAYTVAQRTREIGLRLALGADAGRVRRGVLAQMGRVVAVGVPLGIGVALLLGRVAESLLFGLAAHDPLALIPSAVVLMLAALAAAWVPAWRAARVSPSVALRGD